MWFQVGLWMLSVCQDCEDPYWPIWVFHLPEQLVIRQDCACLLAAQTVGIQTGPWVSFAYFFISIFYYFLMHSHIKVQNVEVTNMNVRICLSY